SMAFTPDGAMLASGSRDTTIVIWDLVELRGSHRLRGHRDAVTQPGLGNLADLGDAAVLLSASKDSLIKIWDLNTQHCVDTTMAHQPDVSAMLWVPELNALLTSGGDATLKVWNVAVGPL
ncbi:WD40 repeat-like protein, partial [Caulochytrium protostelioides]